MKFPRMVEIIPPGKKNNWRVEHFGLSEEEAHMLAVRDIANPERLTKEWTPPGMYARLMCDHTVWMTDTNTERTTHQYWMGQAHGHVMVGGLGLGMCVCGLLEKPEVTEVTVVELHQEVIDLVKPHLNKVAQRYKKPLYILYGDVNIYQPNAVFDCIWLDIWPTICADNLDQMDMLIERYDKYLRCGSAGPYCSWVKCWSQDELYPDEQDPDIVDLCNKCGANVYEDDDYYIDNGLVVCAECKECLDD